ncbi:hypothetical protein AXF42_Ash021639 [Apostasia shenzhenica]|uniref:Uncharacterized protein n=1 Tax=Apostasia shenzhenica TaxID=1088818 RepID=A0A2H9ZUB1_9ASPA|nr:hypothetical protein AXF42_Ash021639 [Apostasia shenzhenica]
MDFFSTAYAAMAAQIGAAVVQAAASLLNEQMDFFSTAYAAMAAQIGAAEVQAHLAKSLFGIVIGSNDIFSFLNSDSRASDSSQQHFI